MCGYTGFIWKSGETPDLVSSTLARVGALLQHRGPDDEGMHIGRGFAVVHRRLSIIDRAHGRQPMVSSDGRFGLAYNGEIYNYRELKKDLEREGCRFESDCDTEVLFHLFMREGAAAFSRLDGMFTAFIWDFRDSSNEQFFLVRDPLGIKPLYLYEDDEKLVFSSELLPLLATGGLDLSPDPTGLASYLTYRYVQAPYTLFRNIRRVEGGTYYRIVSGRSMSWRFWDLPMNENAVTLDEAEAAEELRALLRKSVLQQQMSDVPVGLLLSGGVDSSVIAAICSNIGVSLTSFNIGFPDLNEFAYSKEVASKFGLPHVTVETTPSEIVSRFESVVLAMDEPIADPACFPLHILCDTIKTHVTVVLSGEGSDEMLGGYNQYRHVFDGPPASVREKFKQFLAHSWYFDQRPPITKPINASRLLRQRIYFDERSLLNGMLAYDLKTWLPENLMAKADKMLMSHSLEGRFPFLSVALVEFACGLPEAYKLGKGGGKRLLKAAFGRDLPSTVLNRPKMGFSVPVGNLVMEMRDQLYDLLDWSRRGIFADLLDHDALRRDFDEHYSGRSEKSLWLWTVLVLLQWERLAAAD